MLDINDFSPILRMGITIDEEVYIAKKVLSVLSGENGRILDYACGNCLIPIYLSLNMNNEIYAIDDWKYFNKKDAERLISKYNAKVKLFDGLEKIPFGNNFFDIVYSVMYIYNLRRDKLKNTFDEINRVLKEEGKLLLVDIIQIRGKIRKELEERKYSLIHYEEANGLFFSLEKIITYMPY